MAIKRVWIEEGCIACRLSETLCPEVFRVDETAQVIEGVDFTQYELQIMEAAEACPVEVIKFERDDTDPESGQDKGE
jgi:ferredoxin